MSLLARNLNSPTISLSKTTSMSPEKTYWRSIGELTNHADFLKHAGIEFNLPTQAEQDETPGGHNRRDFLKLMGFGVATATLASCEAPFAKPSRICQSRSNWILVFLTTTPAPIWRTASMRLFW